MVVADVGGRGDRTSAVLVGESRRGRGGAGCHGFGVGGGVWDFGDRVSVVEEEELWRAQGVKQAFWSVRMYDVGADS